ncbi:polysaccharide pyruvyl transferase family protein [Rheinheimera sp. WS51]|uniref:polysaccharide pyruvyl transferase family protein n=1 Tax=Rheinheimera sp. WS51 TaxID=3425886 RepID=UPI003D91EA7D
MNSLQYNLTKITSHFISKVRHNRQDAFWWIDKKNFGDLLTPELFATFGKTAIHCYPDYHFKAGLTAVGSLIQMLPSNYQGGILGTGLIKQQAIQLPDAHFYSVRGELTKQAMGLSATTATGDLGLIADRLLTKTQHKKYSLGLIPHYVDKHHPVIQKLKQKYPQQILVINVEQSAKKVVEQIACCQCIASSSLHGIIVADSLGLPSVWLKLSEQVVGEGFKFYDYNSSINAEQQPITPNDFQSLLDLEKLAVIKDPKLIAQKKIAITALVKQALAK